MIQFFALILWVNRGEKIQCLSEEGDWAKIKRLSGTQGYVHSSLLKYGPIPDIEIVDWSWRTDPSFGTNGTIIWIVELRNNTEWYIDMIKVEISIYDASGRLTETDFQFVQGLAPGGTASSKSYATYYGTEKTARLRIVEN